jgi:tetratricopeptide (TPR) repeat protein
MTAAPWRLLALAACLATGVVADVAAKETAPAVQPAAFDGVDDRIKRGDWQGAAEQVVAVLDDPAHKAHHARAWALLGRALRVGNLPFAAHAAWLEALRLDPHQVADDYPVLLATAAEIDEEAAVGALVGKAFDVPMSEDSRRRVALYAARSAFREGSWGTMLGLLPLVGDEGSLGVDAQILRGVALAQQSKYGEALVPLLSAVEMAARDNRDAHAINTIELNVARTFFATNNFERAMEYYDKVDRADAYWPTAHFERAWAHFRVDDMAGTLALLHTHGSPFFDDWYLPESELLRAQALFLMCKFASAIQAIDHFQTTYTPIHATLGETLGGLDAASAFADGRNHLAKSPTRLPKPILRKLDWDDRFKDAAATVDRADEELSRLGGLGGKPFARRAIAAATTERDAIIEREGSRLLAQARTARDELKDMLEGIELTRIDLLTLESDLYSRAAATGETLAYGDRSTTLRGLYKKGKRVWPFQGEYWADELGWYKVTARPDCPASLQRGEP